MISGLAMKSGPVLTSQLDIEHDDALQHAHLGCGEADAGGGVT